MMRSLAGADGILFTGLTGNISMTEIGEPSLLLILMILVVVIETSILVILGFCHVRRCQNRKQLERRKEQLSLALKAIGEGLWDCEIATGKDYFSDEWLKLLGYEPGELEEHKSTWKSIIHPEDLQRVLDEVHRHMRGETPYYHSEHRCKTKNGHWIWVLDRGKVVGWDTAGNPARMIGTQRDITPRKKAEHAREESEQRYRTIVENINEGMIKQDLTGCILEVNECFCSMTGYARDELLGKPVTVLTDAESDAGIIEKLDDLLEKKSLQSQWKIVKKGGKVIHTSVNSSLVEYDNERHIQSFLRDISLRVKMEEELLEASKLAENANKAKGEFLANMSHEIRTPMNAILGFTELTMDTDLTKEQRENLNTVLESSNDLLVIINDILDFSKIEAGRLDLTPRKMNLYGALKDVIDMVKQSNAQKGLSFLLNIDPDTPEFIMVDPVRLRQILINLMNNAVKFTKKGSVEIYAELYRPAEIIGGHASPGQKSVYHSGYEKAIIQFAVKDTGIGIPQGRREEIFDNFTQADGSAARKYGGTGLGLSISRKLVDLMEGRIWVDSVPGSGSTFYFTIAAEIPSTVQAAEVNQSNSEEEHKHYQRRVTDRPLRILLADDKPTNLLIATRLLEKEGHQLVSVSDGSEALLAFEQKKFDCILMDVQMPVMDGFQATRHIRKREQASGSHVTIIAMTAHAMTGDREKCLAEGMDDYIAKPVRIADLRKLLMKWGYGEHADCQTD